MSVDTSLRAARRHERNGERDEAAAILSDLVRRFPGNRRARAALAAMSENSQPRASGTDQATLAALLARGRHAEVVASIAPLLSEAPRSVPLLCLLAAALSGLGRHRDAGDMLEAASREAPGDAEILTRLGEARRVHGAWGAAALAFGQAAKLGPAAPGPLTAMADALIGAGEAGAAGACLDRATQLARDPAARSEIAALLGRIGRWPDAAELYALAAEAAPDDPQRWLRFGSAACMAGQHARGIPALQRAIADGAPVQAQVALGHAQLQTGDADGACDAFSRALMAVPEDREARFGLGEARHAQGDLAAAADAYERVLAATPGDAGALNNLGMVRLDMGDPDAAIAALERSLTSRPDDPGTLDNIAVALVAKGAFAAAADTKRRALAIDPDRAECARGLVPLADAAELDGLARTFERVLAGPAAQGRDGVAARFGLAEIAMRRRAPEAAMRHLDSAAVLHRRVSPADPARHVAELGALRAVFERPTPALAAPDPAPFAPIFIVGMPRSGTTLVEQILSAHPRVSGIGESEALPLAIRRSGGLAAPPTAAQLAEIRARYFDAIAALGTGGAAMVTDKMPMNYRFIGVIAAAFPEARIVHMNRTPEAVCWSCYRSYFRAGGLDFTFHQTELGRYHAAYRDLMAFWHARLPGHVRDLDYEALTEDPEAEARRLLADLDLPWDPAILDLDRNARAVRTASAAQVRKPIYRGSSQAWRDYTPWLAPLLAELRPEDGISGRQSG